MYAFVEICVDLNQSYFLIPQGLGMMTTVTLPVYNTVEGTVSFSIITKEYTRSSHPLLKLNK